MISHHPVIYVVTKTNGDSVVEKLPTTPLQEFTTADGIYNISLIKMDMNMMMMIDSIL